MKTRATLVTVAMPVRNGGHMFAAALESVQRQDHTNLEILISDNASTDESGSVARAAASLDDRITYVRHDQFQRAYEHLTGLVPRAHGQFFMWAAHDDLRSPDYVSGLLRGFDDDTILTFGDLELMYVHGAPGTRQAYDFDTGGLGPVARIRKQALMQCFHFYGLWRTAPLAALPKVYCPWWPDLPLMMAAAASGRFRHVPGPVFRYYETIKGDDERARYQDNLPRSASKLDNIGRLTAATYATLRRTSGPAMGVIAAGLVLEKCARLTVASLQRRLLSRVDRFRMVQEPSRRK